MPFTSLNTREGMDCIQVSQDRLWWWVFVNTAKNISCSITVTNSLFKEYPTI